MRNNTIAYTYSLLLAFIFITLFSSSTSFLYSNVENLDADFFSVIGKYWTKNTLPYVDLWDHKGPIIYFYNALGYWITNNRIGVFIIQVLSLSMSIFFTYKLFREEFDDKKTYLLVIFSLFGLANDYGTAGNCVEEYLLPLLSLAFYFMYKWVHKIDEKANNHSYKYAFVYGLVLGFSLMTRMTNAIGVCGGILVIAIFLLLKGKYVNLLHNIFAFLLGVIVIILPFILYFYKYNALDEMIYGTLLFNFEYIQNAPELDPFSFNQKLYLIKSSVTVIVLFLVSILLFLRPDEKRQGMLWCMVAIISMSWLMTGNGFDHYFIITFPYFAIAINELYRLLKKDKETIIRRIARFGSITYIIILTILFSYSVYIAYKGIASDNNKLSFYSSIKKKYLQNTNSFVAYNVSPYIYLYLDLKPYCRFFAYQDDQISFGKTLRKKVIDEYSTRKPLYILVRGKETAISDLLRSNYKIVNKYDGNIRLYSLIE
ncbi:MAG: glycosyltransferase family 39 protein [Prevotella sp.]|nr:glycosyltransferase family 39 protein [Prevotella sp.]